MSQPFRCERCGALHRRMEPCALPDAAVKAFSEVETLRAEVEKLRTEKADARRAALDEALMIARRNGTAQTIDEILGLLDDAGRMVCPACETDQPIKVFDRDSGLCAACEDERRRRSR